MNGDVNKKGGNEELTSSISISSGNAPYFYLSITNGSVRQSTYYHDMPWKLGTKQKIIIEKDKNNLIHKCSVPYNLNPEIIKNIGDAEIFHCVLVNSTNITSSSDVTLPTGSYNTAKNKVNLTIETCGPGVYPCDASGNITYNLLYKVKDVPISNYKILHGDFISKLTEQYENKSLYYTTSAFTSWKPVVIVTEWDTI